MGWWTSDLLPFLLFHFIVHNCSYLCSCIDDGGKHLEIEYIK
jgi:hypothetical protein